MCSCLVVSSSVSLTICPGSANFLPERLCVAGRWRSISFVYLRESHRVVRPAGHMYAPGVPLSSLKGLVHGGWEESMVIS